MAAFFWSLKPDEADAVRAAGLDAWKERVVGLWPDCAPITDQIDSFDQLSLARYGHHTLTHARRAAAGDHRRRRAFDQPAARAGGQHGAARRGRAGACAGGRSRASRTHSRPMSARAGRMCASSRRCPRCSRPSTSRIRRCCPSSATGWWRRSRRIPPAPQLLASMVAGTMVDPFAPIGLKEVDWN